MLPHLAKLLEKIQLVLNFDDLQIKENQHAFPKNQSIVSVVISMTQNWFDVTDNSNTGRKVSMYFLGFEKSL